jgi:hypothetical protein
METLTLEQAREATADHGKIGELIGAPPAKWAGRCHAVSLALLRTGLAGDGRVARGTAHLIGSQHSWIVLGNDCYDPGAVIVDPTFRAATGRTPGQPMILAEYAVNLSHRPHGHGSIFAWGKPCATGGGIIGLTPKTPLSEEATAFLDLLGPLDQHGWMQLALAPVGGWPAAEIIAAMDDTPQLSVPIDILGMITDRNPGNYYR